MCSVNFLLITSRAAGTGMLMIRALTSKDARVSSDATFISIRDSAKASLSLTNEKLLLQYH